MAALVCKTGGRSIMCRLQGFGWLAFVSGILFLVVQTVIFIEFTFELNETWIENDGTPPSPTRT